MYRTPIVIMLLAMLASPAFAAVTTLSPQFTAGVTYTDNINRTEDKEDDVTATLSPGATLDITGHRAGLFLSYNPTYAVYKNNPQNDGWRHYAGLGFWWDLSSRTHLSLTDNLTISEDPADDVLDQSGTRRGRSRYGNNTANIDLSHRFGPSDSLNLGYTHSTTINDDELYEDNTRHNPYANMTWWFVPDRYGLDLIADYTRGEFDRSDDFDSWLAKMKLRRRFNSRFDMFLQYGYISTDYTGETEDYKFYDLGIGFDYVVGDHVNTSFTVSYLRRDSETTGEEEDVFASWDINAQWPLRKGSLGLTGSSGYTQDQFAAGGRGFSLYSGIKGNVSWRFARTISGDVFAGYRYNRFIDFEPEKENHTADAGAGLSWQALSWMRFGLSYNYIQLFSNIEITEYNENRVYLSVTLSPRRPIRLLD
jgi:hypothetical protein